MWIEPLLPFLLLLSFLEGFLILRGSFDSSVGSVSIWLILYL